MRARKTDEATPTASGGARALLQGVRALVRRFAISERADVSCCGVTVAQAATLEALRRQDGMRLGALGRALGIAPSTLTRNLARLEEDGLVSRRPDPRDSRSFQVALTAAGRRAAERLERQEEAFAQAVLDRLAPARRAQAVEGLTALLAAVREATEACCPGAFDHLMDDFPRGAPSHWSATVDKGAVDAEQTLVERVKERYGRIAQGEESGCCGPAPCCGTVEKAVALGIGYGAKELAGVPQGANLGLGCGAPVDALRLSAAETVLDLGSGPGLDAFLAAKQVGPAGRVIGVDMTPAMLKRARATAAKAGLANVEFREGRLEALPVADASVDAVTSNCVINLVPDKAAVFREIARVLKPGGRLVVSDIVLDGPLPEVLRKDLLAYVGCVAGAMERERYFALAEGAGLGEIEVLKDVDYLASIGEALPDEAQRLLGRLGLTIRDVAGIVRSVTFRAVRPRA